MNRGKSQREVARELEINYKTTHRWWNRYKKEGHYKARKNPGAARRIDAKEFERYVRENPSKRSEDIGKEFGITGSGARYYLRKLGYSYKKSL